MYTTEKKAKITAQIDNMENKIGCRIDSLQQLDKWGYSKKMFIITR